jgi:hypothetical protein
VTEPDTEPDTLTSELEARIQEALNKFSADLGAQYVVDWAMVCEVSTGDGAVFRWVGNAAPWRAFGLFKAATVQLEVEMTSIIYTSQEDGEDED